MGILYKFIPIERIGFEQPGFLPMLTLRFSPVNELNDPYECYIKYTTKKNKTSLNHLFTDNFLKAKPRFKNGISEDFAFSMKCEKECYFGNCGILSLSRNNDSTVMWAHYASGHRGLVVGIDENYLLKKYKSYRLDGKCDVYYRKNARLVFKQWTIPLGFAYCKSPKWKYEKECRFLSRKSQVVKIPPKYIKEIIFGYNMPPQTRLAIYQLREAFKITNVPFKVIGDIDSESVTIDTYSDHCDCKIIDTLQRR